MSGTAKSSIRNGAPAPVAGRHTGNEYKKRVARRNAVCYFKARHEKHSFTAPPETRILRKVHSRILAVRCAECLFVLNMQEAVRTATHRSSGLASRWDCGVAQESASVGSIPALLLKAVMQGSTSLPSF